MNDVLQDIPFLWQTWVLNDGVREHLIQEAVNGKAFYLLKHCETHLVQIGAHGRETYFSGDCSTHQSIKVTFI